MNMRKEMLEFMYRAMSEDKGVHDEVNETGSKAEEVVCAGIDEKSEEYDKRLNALFTWEKAAFMAGAEMVLDFIGGGGVNGQF